MPKLILQSVRREAVLFVIVPAAVASFIGIILWVLIGSRAGYSVLLGMAIWLIPNMIFAYRLFSNVSPRAAQRIVITFYLFEAIKLLLTVALFIGIIKLFVVDLGYLFLGYAIAMVAFCLMPLITKK